MLQQSRNEFPFECFKMEATNILTELDDLHKMKKRQIDRVFNVLFDNMPSGLKDMPINDTLEKLLTLVRKKVNDFTQDLANDHKDEHEKVVEDSMADFRDEIDECDNQNKVDNLTSTVKKLNPIKNIKMLKNLDNITMIGENDSDNAKKQDYSVGIFYYLKDGTKVETKLKDLKAIDLENLHDNCLSDVQDVCELLIDIQKC